MTNEIKIGFISIAGIVEDLYGEQYFASGYWRPLRTIRKAESVDQIAESILYTLATKSFKTLRLYHGTDSVTATRITKESVFGHRDGSISFFTTDESEARGYARMKSQYRQADGAGTVFEFDVPSWAVSINSGSGEVETCLSFKIKDDTLVPEKESIAANVDFILGNIDIETELGGNTYENVLESVNLDSASPHSLDHWARVYSNAEKMGAEYGIESEIFKYFALFHDSSRESDFGDYTHGRRGGKKARRLFSRLGITRDEMDLLEMACDIHSTAMPGDHDLPIEIQICLDADRLDLVRLGVKPDLRYLFTDYAKTPKMLEFANMNYFENTDESINRFKHAFGIANENSHNYDDSGEDYEHAGDLESHKDDSGGETLVSDPEDESWGTPKKSSEMGFDEIALAFNGDALIDLRAAVQGLTTYTGGVCKTSVANLTRWIRENSDKYENKYVVLYHGTSAKLPILGQGLKKTSSKTKKNYLSQPGYVYLSLFPDSARMFGEMANPGDEVAVYAVRVKLCELLPDKNQLYSKRLYGCDAYINLGGTLAESLIYGQGARVKRDIDSYDIRDVTGILFANHEREGISIFTDNDDKEEMARSPISGRIRP